MKFDPELIGPRICSAKMKRLEAAAAKVSEPGHRDAGIHRDPGELYDPRDALDARGR